MKVVDVLVDQRDLSGPGQMHYGQMCCIRFRSRDLGNADTGTLVSLMGLMTGSHVERPVP